MRGGSVRRFINCLAIGATAMAPVVFVRDAFAREAPLTLVEQDAVLVDLFNAYAPHVIGDTMWLGGWLTEDDKPDDQVYVSRRDGAEWQPPVSILERNGFAFNDPSALQRDADRFVYYTLLDKSCSPAPGCYLVWNLTGLAQETAAGTAWTELGTLIELDNGLAECGAWAPSALRNGDENWIYYHGGSPSYGPCRHPTGTVFLTRFTPDHVPLGTEVVALPRPVYNVDVSRRPDGRFMLAANSLDLTRIVLFTSGDGRAWTEFGDVAVGNNLIWKPTPHITWVDNAVFDLWFGHAASVDDTEVVEIRRWRWRDDNE